MRVLVRWLPRCLLTATRRCAACQVSTRHEELESLFEPLAHAAQLLADYGIEAETHVAAGLQALPRRWNGMLDACSTAKRAMQRFASETSAHVRRREGAFSADAARMCSSVQARLPQSLAQGPAGAYATLQALYGEVAAREARGHALRKLQRVLDVAPGGQAGRAFAALSTCRESLVWAKVRAALPPRTTAALCASPALPAPRNYGMQPRWCCLWPMCGAACRWKPLPSARTR